MLILMLGLMAAMVWSGHPSDSGRILRRWLVERPAVWLSRMRLAHVALAFLALAVLATAFVVFDAEGLKLAGATVAEAGTWFIAFDVATYIEVYAVLLLLGATRQARMAAEAVRAMAHQVVGRATQTCRGWVRQAAGRVRRARRAGRRDQDPDGAGWTAFATA